MTLWAGHEFHRPNCKHCRNSRSLTFHGKQNRETEENKLKAKLRYVYQLLRKISSNKELQLQFPAWLSLSSSEEIVCYWPLSGTNYFPFTANSAPHALLRREATLQKASFPQRIWTTQTGNLHRSFYRGNLLLYTALSKRRVSGSFVRSKLKKNCHATFCTGILINKNF